jgi:hypothetical protein
MKTIIYTYKNFRPVFFELDRYYLLRTEAEYDVLIDKLLDIDAVTTPDWPKGVIPFPVILELKAGFTPRLVQANLKKMKSQQQELKRLRKSLK